MYSATVPSCEAAERGWDSLTRAATLVSAGRSPVRARWGTSSISASNTASPPARRASIAVESGQATAHPGDEIGRASCRERVGGPGGGEWTWLTEIGSGGV